MKKKCCLSFGKCSKKLWLLILASFITNISLFLALYFFTMNTTEFDSLNILSYLFFQNLCQSFMFIPHLISKKMNASRRNSPISKNIEQSNSSSIFNESSNSITFTLQEKLYFIFFIFLKLFTEIFLITYLFFVFENRTLTYELTFSFQFELICLFLLSKLFYNNQYYKHQYIVITIVTIFEIYWCFLNYLNKGAGYFFLTVHCNIIHSFLRSTIIAYIKGLMEYKYISPYKVCFIFGLLDLIIVTIVYIIASFFPCEGYLCLEEYNGKKYFGHILSIFDMNIFKRLLFFTLKSILLVLNYVIINEFSVCHYFLPIKINQLFENSLWYISFGFAIDDVFFKLIIASIFVIFGLSIFCILLFLEIIEINCCKINYNTKKNIEKRAVTDLEFDDLNFDNNTEDSFNDNNVINDE